jgi:hypothetical protein
VNERGCLGPACGGKTVTSKTCHNPIGTAVATPASGGGVRGGEAAPRSFFGWFLGGGLGAPPPKTNQKLGYGAQPRDVASALALPYT